jgi:hypothetical protein
MTERNENLITQLGKEFKKELQVIVTKIMIDKGVPKQSDLINTIEFTDNSRDSLYMWVNDYYVWLSQGRKPKIKKVPVQALIKWIKRYGITSSKGLSINQLAFAIQNSIYRSGIKTRGYRLLVQEAVEDHTELRVSDAIEELIGEAMLLSLTVNGKYINTNGK